jgi:hypothetical protein
VSSICLQPLAAPLTAAMPLGNGIGVSLILGAMRVSCTRRSKTGKSSTPWKRVCIASSLSCAARIESGVESSTTKALMRIVHLPAGSTGTESP